TIAETFVPSPNGIGVEEAYRHAVEVLFGPEGSKLYRAVGGLKNRAPRALVEAMFAESDKPIVLTARARHYFRDHASKLAGYVPEGKGVPLERWNAADPFDQMVELVVRLKLQILAAQVGTQLPNGDLWPALTTGFRTFWW